MKAVSIWRALVWCFLTGFLLCSATVWLPVASKRPVEMGFQHQGIILKKRNRGHFVHNKLRCPRPLLCVVGLFIPIARKKIEHNNFPELVWKNKTKRLCTRREVNRWPGTINNFGTRLFTPSGIPIPYLTRPRGHYIFRAWHARQVGGAIKYHWRHIIGLCCVLGGNFKAFFLMMSS